MQARTALFIARRPELAAECLRGALGLALEGFEVTLLMDGNLLNETDEETRGRLEMLDDLEGALLTLGEGSRWFTPVRLAQAARLAEKNDLVIPF